MNVLVTGSTGFIGSNLIRALGEKPFDISPFSRSKGQDLTDFSSLVSALSHIDTVIHCAGYAHAHQSADSEEHFRINRDGTLNLIAAMQEQGVKNLVFLSTVKAAAADTPYGQAKFAAEEAIRKAVKDKLLERAIILRLGMVYGQGSKGNLERMITLIQKGFFPPLPETNNRRSMIYIKDVVNTLISSLDSLNKMPAGSANQYLLVHPKGVSGAEIYRQIRKAIGLKPQRWSVPYPVLKAAATVAKGLQYLIRRSLPFNDEVLDKLLGDEFYEPTKEIDYFEKALPQYSLEEGLKDMFESKK